MYSNCYTASSRATDSLCNFQSSRDASTASPMLSSTTATQLQQQQHYQVALSEYDPASQLNSDQVSHNAGNYNSCSSGCTSYMGSPSSLASYDQTQRVSDRLMMQRSVSSQSLQKNYGPHHHPFSTLFAELLDPENGGPVRKVYSTGDLQRVNGMHHYHHQSDSPLSTESSMIIEAMSRSASPYSPEEKKVRIERYRSKRNQRNFNKKIKYACRKTLADSRPRIRGRFARNEEIVVMNPKVDQWSNSNGEEEDEEYDNWDNLFDSLVSANLADQETHQDSSSFGVFC